MKIICMDCQTESHIDDEAVKAQKRFECHHCAEEFRMNAASEIENTSALITDMDVAVDSDSAHEQSFDITALEHEDTLDVSVIPFAPAYPVQTEVNEVLSSVPDEATLAPVEETSVFTSQQTTANPSSEIIAPPPPQPDSEDEPAMPEAPAEIPSSEEKIAPVSGESKKMGLVTFSAPKLIAISAAFVLLTSVAGMINSSVGKVNTKSESSVQAAAKPTKQEVKQREASAPAVTVTETSAPPAPASSPSAPQEASAAANIDTAPANQPAVAETPAPQPAMNEPAATGAAAFTIQVGSHNEMDLADNQMAKLKAFGHDPRVVSVEIPKRGKWYRVQVGSFADRKEAQAFGAQLVSKGAVESFVVVDR